MIEPEECEKSTLTPLDPLMPVVGATTRPLYEMLRHFAATNVSILLRGPTGAGKSRLAQWVHSRSPRQAGPFVVADLHTVPDDLMPSALFGHRRGAFTGAIESRQGRIAEADGGTLFLDEVDKLSLANQALLLRVLEAGEYREVGGRALRADVRVVLGTNAELESEVQEGRFRQDLFYRISTVPVHLPPLDARRDEIAGWARYMLSEVHAGHVPTSCGLPPDWTPAALATLEVQRWPGNLRQLRHVVERAYLLARAEGGSIVVDDEHVQLALQLDLPCGRRESCAQEPLLGYLEAAAQLCAEFVLQSEARGDPPISLATWEGFSGLILDAVDRARGLDTASTALFELERQVRGGNYLKTYQRHRARGELLRARLLRRAN